jgi:hypothetical protein
MPGSKLDLSMAPSAQEPSPEQPKGPACHRSFQFILDPTAAMAGISRTANVMQANMPCMREKCALYDVDSEICGDLLQAKSLSFIAEWTDKQGVR